MLWSYIAGDISEDDVMEYHFGNKLHCQPHEFGDKNENFLKQRMVQSTTLLDLALATIEQWSQIQLAHYKWLNATSQRDPELALAATETYLAYVSRTKPYFYDHENQLVQLMTRLFAEAEEREEADHGEMIKRVVAVQDLLLSLGVNSISDWLKAAERQ